MPRGRTNRTQALYPIQVSPEDADLAVRYSVMPVRNSDRKYALVHKAGRASLVHRVIAARMLGRELVKGEIVDHINRDGLDNRRENLRVCSASQNSQNRRRRQDSNSCLKGVSWHKQRGRWLAQIAVGGKRISLGLHDTPELAHAAYCAAAEKYHGEFARTE